MTPSIDIPDPSPFLPPSVRDKVQNYVFLRAVEWLNWPAFITQPIVPAVFIFVTWWYMLVALLALGTLWALIRESCISFSLASRLCLFAAWLRWPVAITCGAILIIRRQYWIAPLAGLWPVVLVLIPSSLIQSRGALHRIHAKMDAQYHRLLLELNHHAYSIIETAFGVCGFNLNPSSASKPSVPPETQGLGLENLSVEALKALTEPTLLDPSAMPSLSPEMLKLLQRPSPGLPDRIREATSPLSKPEITPTGPETPNSNVLHDHVTDTSDNDRC